jgi:hypothetical protein
MLSPNRYRNSICRNNYLHDFRQVKETDTGYLERCVRCGKQMHFPANISNHAYLSYHIRSALQPGEPLYEHEYAKKR